MIELTIKTDGKDVYDSYDETEPTIKEVGLVLLRLEQIKWLLINKQFESKFEVSEGN